MLQTISFWISRWIWSACEGNGIGLRKSKETTPICLHIYNNIWICSHIFWSGQTKVNRPTDKKDNHKTYEQNAKQKAMLMLMCSYFIRCIFFVSVCFTSRSYTWIYTLFSGYSTRVKEKKTKKSKIYNETQTYASKSIYSETKIYTENTHQNPPRKHTKLTKNFFLQNFASVRLNVLPLYTLYLHRCQTKKKIKKKEFHCDYCCWNLYAA